MNQPIQGSLEYWAQIKPNSAAIIDENHSVLTWGEWNRQSDLLADSLERKGLGAGDIVAVRSQIRPEWFVINRALAKLGCIQVGLNWHFTFAEALHVMQDSGAKAVIFDDTDPDTLLPLRDHLSLKAIVGIKTKQNHQIEQYDDLISERNVNSRISKGNAPPLIIYTSGTTGRPKGVYRDPKLLAEKQALIEEYRKNILNARGFTSGGKTLINTPLHHALGPSNAQYTHQYGGTVVLLKKFDPVKTLELIEEHKINEWTCVPTLLKRISRLPKEILDRYDVSSLTSLIVGAAPVPITLKEWAISYFGDHCVYEGYGSSEVSLVTLLPPEMQKVKPGSCGYPYRHVEINIRNVEGENLKPGEIGIIWAKTPVCIDSYLNKQKLGTDLLDERGFFQTGDMGYLDEDGYLYICDRIKDMIISGGVNIYPAEIEAALQKHPAIQDAAVIGIPDDEFGEQIKAFCEIKAGSAVTQNELIEFCRNELASYKRPRSIEFVNELPRNTVGKILKWELRKPYWEHSERKV